MAVKLFLIMGFFAVVVLTPINAHYRRELFKDWYPKQPDDASMLFQKDDDDDGKDKSFERTWLWSYVIFTYLFAALTMYFINTETVRVIRRRQDYLGSQTTITDRTFRLTGVPLKLRSEARLTAVIEKMGIGQVEDVTLCRDWKVLDDLVRRRELTLIKLEKAWAQNLKTQYDPHNHEHDNEPDAALPDAEPTDEEAQEDWRLLRSQREQPHILEGQRPQVKIWYGPFHLRNKKVDAIDYFEEKLRRLDEQIVEARQREYIPTDMALVTMDSVASCQMFIQARIDPRPGRLLTKAMPSPSDMIWKNTYSPRGIRRLKSWAITVFICILTVLFIFPTASLASLLNICNIENQFPAFSAFLKEHSIVRSFVQNGVPTLVVSLLNVAVPYLYDWLSNCQGMISQGDIELSLISKNFFFTFFNTFFVFAISKTGLDFMSKLQELLKDTSNIPMVIAADVESLSNFYVSFIILQGVGLMPFRILQVGSLFTYPFYKLASSTPRDYDSLRRPGTFQYGFYLPTALLVFNLCLIYSVLWQGFEILFVGVIYFAFGYFTYKYMLLYSMDQPQHATGGAWRLICRRIIVGLVVFEIVMIGDIASFAAFFQSVAVAPLVPFTIWYSYYFARRFEPLTKYIALRNIRSNEAGDDEAVLADEDESQDAGAGGRPNPAFRRGSTLDELREQGMSFVNPSLTTPLVQPWIYKDPPPLPTDEDGRTEASSQDGPTLVLPNADSSLGIGEDNVWTRR